MLRALASATALSPPPEGGAPQWVHLLPAGVVTTVDGRGPYRVGDAARLAAESLAAAGGKMPIDENHSTDIAAPDGRPSPARGWIVALEARDDGIHGKVEWTESGRQLIAEHAYRSISPAFIHDKQNNVLRILRAALTNTPNLRGLTALHMEQTMEELLSALRDKLGLPTDADQAAITAKVGQLMTDGNPAIRTALQAQLKPIAVAVGLSEDADSTAVLGAVKQLAQAKGADKDQVITALQSELKTVTDNFNTLNKQLATDKATAFVDAAIAAGRVGVKPMRDHYIARHAASAEGAAAVEKEIGAMPLLSGSGARPTPPTPDKDGKITLDESQVALCAQLGISTEDYAKTLAAEAARNQEAA